MQSQHRPAWPHTQRPRGPEPGGCWAPSRPPRFHPRVAAGTLTRHREVVERGLSLLHVLWPLLVADEGAVVLEEEVPGPPGLDVFPCGRVLGEGRGRRAPSPGPPGAPSPWQARSRLCRNRCARDAVTRGHDREPAPRVGKGTWAWGEGARLTRGRPDPGGLSGGGAARPGGPQHTQLQPPTSASGLRAPPTRSVQPGVGHTVTAVTTASGLPARAGPSPAHGKEPGTQHSGDSKWDQGP